MGARHPSITPFEAFATKDGHVIIAAGNDGLFVKLTAGAGPPELADNPLFKTQPAAQPAPAGAEGRDRGGHLPQDHRRIGSQCSTRAGVPCGPINNVDTGPGASPGAARNMLVQVDDPATGALQLAGNPMKILGLRRSADRARRRRISTATAPHPARAAVGA